MIIENEIIEKCSSTELAYLLMDIAVHLGCTIQRYYWTSKLDEDIIEETEPKIDMYDCTVWIRGENLEGVMEVYNQKKKLYENLPSTYTPYTEQEIKDTAERMLKHIF